ncbi:MAG: glycosyltransferase family 1 protein [Candidatus Aminicenantes bacterium]|nr:MAG: glycosyltransferase family 1 protein [Candidatus Aminicenantes bacterium]
MRILRTIESFYPYVTGPANQAYRISAELESRNINSPILTTYCNVDKDLPKREVYNKVHITRFKNQIQIMRYCVSLGMLMNLKDFDIVHSHSYRSFQTDIGCLVSAVNRRPFVLSTHGTLSGYKYILKNKFAHLPYKMYDMATFKNAVGRADAMVVSSKNEYAEALEFGIDKKKIHLIPAGIDIGDYESHQDKSNKVLNLLFVGRISRNRRLEPIIKALQYLNEVKLTIVGSEEKSSSLLRGGYLSELRALVDELRLRERINFAGAKYGKELESYYQAADVFVYTSLYENFGQTLLEAAAAGLPIICTPVGIAPEIVIDGETGFLVSDDPKMISERIRQLNNVSTRREFGGRIKKIVKEKFNWSNTIDQYLQVYQHLP